MYVDRFLVNLSRLNLNEFHNGLRTIRVERIDSIVISNRLTALYFHPSVLNLSYKYGQFEVMIGT